jgi:hypothetical protein
MIHLLGDLANVVNAKLKEHLTGIYEGSPPHKSPIGGFGRYEKIRKNLQDKRKKKEKHYQFSKNAKSIINQVKRKSIINYMKRYARPRSSSTRYRRQTTYIHRGVEDIHHEH